MGNQKLDGREGVWVGPSTLGRILTGKEGHGKQSPRGVLSLGNLQQQPRIRLVWNVSGKAAVGEGGGGWTVGSNEPLEGVGTTASALGLFTLLYLLKVIWIWGDFPHTTKKTAETKSNMLQFKVICHSGFSFSQHTLVLLFARKKRTTLRWEEPQKLVKPFF